MLRGFLTASPPTVAVEIARHRLSAALVVSRDGKLAVAAHAVEMLPAGAINPSLNTSNIADPKTVADALRRVLDRLGSRPKRVALAIPDSVAKVSLLRFEKIPERQRDVDELVRWQVRKAAPFHVEDAQISHVTGHKGPDGTTEVVVVMARKDIVREYETVCEAAGAQAGIVDLTTFNVVNVVLAGQDAPQADADWLLVHVTPDDATMAIVRGEHLVFFRNRAADGEGSLADMVHQTAMYYEDRLSGGGFSRVVLAGAGGQGGQDADYLRKALEQRLGAKVDPIDPRNAATLADRISPNAELLDALAPLVGLIVRERAA
ncbi:MAG: pilus assembly protein PilM [Vicinamibacterales bacterium]|nr:pilus assembly protein PilM [Vicinamibacterales bacterium]